MCDDHGHPALRALRGFAARSFDPHHPEIMCVTCIDGRERGGGNFGFQDNAIRVTEIAAVIPPYEMAPHNTRAKFSFRKLKGVGTIKVTGHSFCGGAQTAIAYPLLEDAPDDEVRDIVQSLHDSGADIPRLRESFLKACEGNVRHAANLLSRHLVLVSLDNISGYPHINSQIMNRQLDVIPLYHMMKEGTGEPSHLERYDVAHKRWVNLQDDAITNMCNRPDNCNSCDSCHSTISDSLKWVFIEAANENNQIESVEVPFHIARLISERREFYQPKLDEMKSGEVDMSGFQPVTFYPRQARVG